MEGVKFAATMGLGALQDRLESAQEAAARSVAQASEAAQSVSSAAAARALETANTAARQASSSVDSLRQLDVRDLTAANAAAAASKLGAGVSGGVTKLGAGVTEGVGALGSTLGAAVGSAVAGGSPSAARRSDGGAPGAKTSDGGSESGGEDSAASNAGLLGRFGFGGLSMRASEKQPLVKGDEEMGGGGVRSPGGAASFGTLGSGLYSIGSSAYSSSMDTLGLGPKKEAEGVMRVCACCPALSYKQRMTGFLLCFLFGMIVSFSALGSIGGLLLGNPRPFAVKYTIGNLLSLGSSSFLVGPAKQCRDMLAPERFLASAIYFATLFGTLFSAFWLKIQVVTFAFVLVQFAALTWYMLSYVPYGQACLKRTVKKVIS